MTKNKYERSAEAIRIEVYILEGDSDEQG